MKLTTLILIAAILSVSAATHAQKITLSAKNASLKTVFRQIKKQTGYDFVCDESIIENATPVTVAIKDATIEEALKKSLENQRLTYTIKDKVIIVKKDEPTIIDRVKDFFAVPIDVHGKVTDSTGTPLIGANIRLKNTTTATVTDNNGLFDLKNIEVGAIIQITYITFISQEITVTAANSANLNVVLKEAISKLQEVIVSTGYQELPKERATGAFTHIDNKTLNRSVGINIIDRLEGVTSGLLLNRNLPLNGANNSSVTIRGRSTIFANAEPLIVLDGFPYSGSISEINPADINSIDILKDAAAASIWGTRASNGVIVITSKRGKNNQLLSVGITSTLTIGAKPDLNYAPQISSADYIDIEQFLFSKGSYDNEINQKSAPISQAVEILSKKRANLISATDADNQLNALRQNDVRADILKYLYRPKVYQQYGLNLSGGGINNRYYLSGGYDKNLENQVSNSYDRLTLNLSNTFSLLKNKLEISADVNFNSSNSNSQSNPYKPFSPYDRLVDNKGNSSAVQTSPLRLGYADTAGNGKLLDWHYYPKDETKGNSPNQLTQYRIKAGLNYKIIPGLSLNMNYQYLKEVSDLRQDNDLSSYYTRNLINTYSSIVNNNVIRILPLGDVLNMNSSDVTSKIGRIQLNLNQVISNDHEVTAILGYEGGDYRRIAISQTYYGYDPGTRTNANGVINTTMFYPFFYNSNYGILSTQPDESGAIDITQSYYTNASYAYKSKYILSGSARRDESNLFGVTTNQKGVPLWSAGLSWIVNKENFYKLNWLTSLKLRASYGYNGNLDKTVSGLLTVANIGLTNILKSNYSLILNPPNPTLRWEKVKTWNAGLDFTLKDNIVSGSIDVFQKNAADLIGNSPIAQQTGIVQYRGNNADMQTRGMDIILNSVNINRGFKWSTSLQVNLNTDKVSNYKAKQGSNLDIVSGNFFNPLEGYSYYAIFSLPSAGLNASGMPQGYLNGLVSTDYAKIFSTLDASQLKYHGSASPKCFGNILNTFGYKNLELSINISYKFDYYFRRLTVFSGSGAGYNQSDFNKRWQKAGDESTTNIPALIYPNSSSSTFFQYSSDLVEKADNIRIQDVKLSYSLKGNDNHKKILHDANFFIYSRNLGILWKATKSRVDPDYGLNIPEPLNISLGINLTL